MRLHHLAIRVRDLDAALAFYRDALGLAETARPRPGSIWLALGDATLMLEETSGTREPEPFETTRPGLHAIALAVDASERDAWEARLAARGIVVHHRTAHTLYLRDPEGNRVALSHHPLVISAAP